jgi:hypothetical protein
LKEKSERAKSIIKSHVKAARRITICVDGWSKKNLASSFLGLSACFFDVQSKPFKAQHVVLNIAQLAHPHTGAAIAECIESCLCEWEISSDQVMMVVSDNGSNMLKAIKILGENAVQIKGTDDYEQVLSHSDSEDDDSQNEADIDENENEEESFEPETVLYRRMKCLAHSLQLVVKKAYKHYDSLLTKARHLIGKIRKSGKAMEEMQSKCGKTVFGDNATRWNSTFNMIKRLLQLRTEVNAALTDIRLDSLQVMEWDRLSELCLLLQPFATQTNILQTDSKSLSYVVPALFDLECHLQSFTANRTISKLMLSDFRERFSCFLCPGTADFNPLPAACCLLDPTVAQVLLTEDLSSLFVAAKKFIIDEVSSDNTCKLILL